MPKTVRITAPWPTLEEQRRHLRIPKARAKELDAMAREGARKIIEAEKKAAEKAAAKRKVKPRNASAAA
jgi:hypothetical protein